MKKYTGGFTLIELMITILIIAVLMIPLSMMMMDSVRAVVYEDTVTEALALARQELAIVANEALADFDSADLQYQDPPKTTTVGNYDIIRRIVHIKGDDNMRFVKAQVCSHGSTEVLVELGSCIERDAGFGAGSGGL